MIPRLKSLSKMPFPFGRTVKMNIYVIAIVLSLKFSIIRSNVAKTEETRGTFHDISKLLKQHKHKSVKFNPELRNINRKFTAEDNIAHDFDDHEIVIPIRLHHETGHPVSHGRHFRRRSRDEDDRLKSRERRDLGLEHDRKRYFRDLAMQQRNNKNNNVKKGTFYDVIPNKYSGESLDFIDENVGNYLDHSVANYSLKAFGEHFLFHLTPYENFLAPNYSLRYVADPAKDKLLHPDVPRHCFYAGYVNGKRDHKAILSVCRGLFGAFRTDKNDYLIQPEDRDSTSSLDEADEEGTKPHRIYRRQTRAFKKGKQSCGYVDTEAGVSETQPNSDYANPSKAERKHGRKKGHHFRRLLENARWQKRREKSRFRYLLKHSEVRSNLSLSGSILHKLGVNTLINSVQVLRELNQHERASFRKRTNSREEDSGKRKRRYLSYARNVEVMVTADNSMLQIHRDVEHYVLTLMAIVNHVYHDPSIENLINIVVVELVVIGDSQVQNGPDVVKDAHTCLRNFCEWQFRHNNPDDSHPAHHDTAVLITGKNICRSETACDTLGLAELGTMCDPRRSCSINEDNGLSTAFTIAHEIGHEFNAPHDNSEKCVDAEGHKSPLNVMSPTLDINAYPWSWSNCSAKFITNFLDNGGGRCLLDEPPQRVLSLPIEEPGEVFSANDQCSFVYGKGVTHCNFMNTCKRLWCVSRNITHGCRTPHVPWADGTKCGEHKWCQRGQCVPENRHRIPIDGNWGEWGRFGECSRECGGGVKIAVRDCNNPKPQYGGQYCTGRRKKYRSCNYHECSEETDIRAQQCANYNSWARNRKFHVSGLSPNAEWIPKYEGIPEQDRCKLICQVKPRGHSWYILKPKVINGTPCGPDTHDVCVDGVCKPAGCDHVLGSDAKEDSCGICNGDNTGCRWVEGSYNTGDIIGYHDVVTIPSGATNIVVTQRSFSNDANDNNYLALKDSRNSYILNGNRSVMRNRHRMRRRRNGKFGKYDYFCDYSGTDARVEMINCSKTTGVDIVVQVLSAGDLIPPNISYKFKIPVVKSPVSYEWSVFGNWTSCNKECDGKMKRKVYCIRSDKQEMSDRRCSHLSKPSPITRPCNTRCRFTWISTGRSECSVRCGKGVKKVEFKCSKILTAFDDQETVTVNRIRELASDSLCSTPKPYKVISCQETCLRWMTSEIGQCTATCGGGVQRWRVHCGAGEAERSDDHCDPLTKPARITSCNEHDCPTWKYGSWSECSVTCGQGTESRSHRCVDHQDTALKSSFCDSNLLEVSRSCFQRSCDHEWSSRVSADNDFPTVIFRGIGRRGPRLSTTTEVTTATTAEAGFRVRSNYNSNTYGDVSVVTSRRHVAVWRTGSWTPCTKSCDGGIRFRYVSCRHTLSGLEMHAAECGLDENKPSAKEACQTNSCPGIWRTGSWSECSASCGKGVRKRYVGCLFNGHYERNSVNCLADERPSEREECNSPTTCDLTTPSATSSGTTTQLLYDDVNRLRVSVTSLADNNSLSRRNRARGGLAVGRWRVGPWTKCSNSCGVGTQKRMVACRTRLNRPAICSSAHRPTSIQTCRGEECPRWRHTAWKECSRTCGDGTRTRRVNCVTAAGVPTHQWKCDVTQRPDNITRCNLRQCRIKHRWRKSAWSSCSASCGRGMKTRRVQCVDARGQIGDDSLCALKRRKPREIHRCMERRKCPKWRTGKWGRCSSTCGVGQMSRSVSCKYKRKVIVDQRCDVTKRPDDVKFCNVSICSTFRWQAEEWSACSVSCGEGVQRRSISCRNVENGNMVSEDTCQRLFHRDKPPVAQACTAGPCTASWVISPWSECSKTCGPGMQRRNVRCTYIHPLNYTELDANSCDVSQKPYDVRDCDRGNCRARYYWRVGSWSQCSASCGLGRSIRRVVCSDRVTQLPQDDDVCQAIPSFRPDRIRTCREAPCVPQTCLQLKIQQHVVIDGEYFLKVGEKMAKIYCKGMNSSQPTEYLTLIGGNEENYSEIFGFRLINADTCPGNGTRDSECACHRDHPDEGYTGFEKIRLDVSNMRVIATDFEFANTRYGKPVAFGVAGDCYSRSNCPQGVFRINLKGTGFTVSEATSWRSYGIDSTKRIYKSHIGDVIAGNCGGYCSRCQPDPANGLLLQHSGG